MTPYEQINNLDDLAIQGGSYINILLPCYYANGEIIDLSEVISYGCTLSLFGEDGVVLQKIVGKQQVGTTHVMQIEILSSYTANLGDCLLVYRPYIEINTDKIIKWQGKLYIGATSPTT